MMDDNDEASSRSVDGGAEEACSSCSKTLSIWQKWKKKRGIATENDVRRSKARKLMLFRIMDEVTMSFISQVLDEEEDQDDNGDVLLLPAKQKVQAYKPRKPKGIVHYKDPETDELKVLPPTMSLWYHHYCKGKDHGMELMLSFEDKFRLRFRLPYNCYLELLDMCNEEASSGGFMSRWRPGSKSATNKPAAPMSLLLLCALRYLGRGWTLDDLEESTAISKEVIRKYIHAFIGFGADKLFKKWVHAPKSMDDVISVTSEYSQAGFPGCVGSMDATHIEHCRIAYENRQAHLSFKLPFTARTYNIVTNHRRRIIGTTEGHPARWNDKSLVKFDEIAMDLHEGNGIMSDLEFELYDYEDDGLTVKQVKYKGAWLLVDNGYMNWGVTVPPMKSTRARAQWRFSKWLESMRKDVECTFGIMKGRWRILKSGIRLHGTETADQTWKTCCALHNWLLEIDGLDNKWGSEWQGGMGDIQEDDLPQSVRTLLDQESLMVNYNGSGMGLGDDGSSSISQQESSDEQAEDFAGNFQEVHGAILVRKLSMKQFRDRLIRHFDIAFQKRELQWPKARLNEAEEPVI